MDADEDKDEQSPTSQRQQWSCEMHIQGELAAMRNSFFVLFFRTVMR
jgi:hypothetical protein